MSLESQPSHPSLGPEPFSCEAQPEHGGVRVLARGSLDVAAAPVLDARLRELRDAGSRRLVVDLSGLAFMDSSGLRLLLVWNEEASRDGFELAVAPGPPAVQRVFELTGATDMLAFEPG
jgi:anti-sigma B factor antagonist